MEKGIRILDYEIRIMPDRGYAVRFNCGKSQNLTRRLRLNGNRLVASQGASIINKKNIINEAPQLVTDVFTAIAFKSNELGDAGAFSKRSQWTYTDAMKRYLKWRFGRRNDKNFEGHAKKSVERFGEMWIGKITRMDVENWIDDELVPLYAKNTIKHAVNPGRVLYNWLKKYGYWEGSNPFENHEIRATKTGLYMKPSINPDEWHLIQNLVDGNSILEQAITLAYYTGLRPSEVYRIRREDFDHSQLTLKVRVVKTGVSTRYIAIPRILSQWVLNREAWHKLNENTVTHRVNALNKKHVSLSGFCMASFRKNFVSMMAVAEASDDAVRIHIGHRPLGPLKHYKTDPKLAIKVLRDYVTKVFDGEFKLKKIERQDNEN
ncbi:MAG: tyrosine-type recombinase/integrase [bacterium]